MVENSNETETNGAQTGSDLRRAQFEVAAGMATATVACAVIAWGLWDLFEITERRVDLAERLGYAAKWSLVPGGCLLIGVLMVANYRFFSPSIDPLAGAEDRMTEIWQRYTRNTLEQTVLFTLGAFAYATVTFQYWLKALPIIALLFVIGRGLFIAGYLIRPTLRATGFAMTFYPIIALYAAAGFMLWG